MKPQDLEKIARIHEQYKSVIKDCDDLFNLSITLAENINKGLHMCLNQDMDIPLFKITNASNIAETIMGVIKEAREGQRGAHVDLKNTESMELIRLILKFKTAKKAALQVELKTLGLDIL